MYFFFEKSKKETALHWAVRTSKVEIVTILMEYGADPFIASSGTTPMELAIKTKQTAIVSLMTCSYYFFF